MLGACLAAVGAAGCNPVSEQYFREGAGADLYSANLAQATQLQDDYVYYICRQAGNPDDQTAAGRSCFVTNWTAFTLAGMNDIEQRCDAYLNWIDAQRRDRTPVLSQIAAIGGTTGAIMGVAGAGTQALSIVATAFGLASTTYANWNSRLLLDVDHSTVQTIVYTRQQEFRKVNVGVIVPDRPAAIYLLRGYLRICMPITIETEINTSVTLAQSGIPLSSVQNAFVRKAVFGGSQPPPPIRAVEPLRPTCVQAVGLPGAETEEEKKISALELGRLQANVLCVPATKDFDPATRDGIRVFQASFGSPSTGTVPSAADHEKLVKRDRGAACPPGARNWWELQRFFLNGAEIPDKIKELQGLLGVTDAGQTGTLDDATRDKIKAARTSMTELKDVTKDANSTIWVTPTFFSQLRKDAAQKQLQENESKPQ